MKIRFSDEEIEASRAYHRRQETHRRDVLEKLRLGILSDARRAIREVAPAEPALRAVFLFGSILRSGQFGERSDVDVAVASDDARAESRLWRALEDILDRPVDVRSLAGGISKAVEHGGECVYAR